LLLGRLEERRDAVLDREWIDPMLITRTPLAKWRVFDA
jgi:hypothetical protein